MAYQLDQTGDIVVNGFEQGIAVSPHKGLANIQNANISTETGEVMASFGRVLQSTPNQTGNGTITASSGGVLTVSGLTITNGIWITVSASTISSVSTQDYFVLTSANNVITLSNYFNASAISPGNSGTATFHIKVNLGQPVASTTERYTDDSGFFQFRYYILDNGGYVWVNDTSLPQYNWFLPDTQSESNPDNSTNVKVLAVGGGGGGSIEGGGAGGQVTYNASFAVSPQTYTVTIGAEGSGTTTIAGNATAGGTSSFGSGITATGGAVGAVTSGTTNGANGANGTSNSISGSAVIYGSSAGSGGLSSGGTGGTNAGNGGTQLTSSTSGTDNLGGGGGGSEVTTNGGLTFDNSASSGNSPFSFTVANETNRILIALVTSQTTPTATYNGASLTVYQQVASFFNAPQSYIMYLKNPSVGSNTFSMTGSGGTQGVIVTSWYNVDLTNTFPTSGSATNSNPIATTFTTSYTASAILEFTSQDTGHTAFSSTGIGSGQTDNSNTGSVSFFSQKTGTTAGSNSVSRTFNSTIVGTQVALELKQMVPVAQKGSNGGSGVVIVSYATGSISGATGGTITTSGGNTIHTFTSSGSFTVPSKSTSLNTIGGLAVLNGWLMVYGNGAIFCKPTTNLGDTTSTTTTYQEFSFSITEVGNNSLPTSPNPHYMYVGHQNTLYYTDGRYIASIFPDSEANSDNVSGVNVQSFSHYTSVSTTGTMKTVITGSLPTNAVDASRIPAAFFCSPGGTVATALTLGALAWIKLNADFTFEVYAAASGGSALDITTGATGTQYFNTFYPIEGAGADTSAQAGITFTPQHLNLPSFEVSQSIAELGSTLIVGTKSNYLYSWNQIDPLASAILPMPENSATSLISVNNMVYILSGNKGNIYLTNGAAVSLVTTIPDYTAGVPGNKQSYIEPYFTWGDIAYIRGRIYVSILDQTGTKAGNDGGIWSFVPTQNFYIGQDTGLALRLENQNSYGTYNGFATVLIASLKQNAISPQYWAGWQSSISSPTYGIDFTATTPVGTTVIETDLIPTGTMLRKQTFSQFEYKLASPLANGETVSLAYRQNSTDSWTTLNGLVADSTGLSGYFPATFEKGQWLQLQATMTPLATSSSSFCRLTELRIR